MFKASSSLTSLFFFFFFSIIIFISAIAAATPSSFINSSCSTTTYPSICVESLSSYASSIQQDPHQLVQTALSLSLNTTLSTKSFVSKLNKFRGLKNRENQALRDCLEEIGDSVDRLSRSTKELKICVKSKGQDFQWHISNVETWVSSAITDENTCTDGFAGRALNGRIKSSIKTRMLRVAQLHCVTVYCHYNLTCLIVTIAKLLIVEAAFSSFHLHDALSSSLSSPAPSISIFL